MKNVIVLPLDYLSYMVKSKHTFRYYNIASKTLEKARLYDETKRVKLEGLAEFKALLPKNPTDLGIREFILNDYHKHEKPFNQRNMKAEYEYLKYHYELASKKLFLSIFDYNRKLNLSKVLILLILVGKHLSSSQRSGDHFEINEVEKISEKTMGNCLSKYPLKFE